MNEMFSVSLLLGGLIFGVFGLWLIRQAKVRADFSLLFFGLTLLVIPYLIDNPWLMWSSGAVIGALAYRQLK